MFKEWRNNKKYFQNLKFYIWILDEEIAKMWKKTRLGDFFTKTQPWSSKSGT